MIGLGVRLRRVAKDREATARGEPALAAAAGPPGVGEMPFAPGVISGVPAVDTGAAGAGRRSATACITVAASGPPG